MPGFSSSELIWSLALRCIGAGAQRSNAAPRSADDTSRSTNSAGADARERATPARSFDIVEPVTLVSLLFWEGCPSHRPALEQLRAILLDLGHGDQAVAMQEVKTEEEAAAQRFIGSPSIRVDGIDPFPVDEDVPTGLTCRVYRLRDGRFSPVPDPQELRERLSAMLGSTKEVP